MHYTVHEGENHLVDDRSDDQPLGLRGRPLHHTHTLDHVGQTLGSLVKRTLGIVCLDVCLSSWKGKTEVQERKRGRKRGSKRGRK